MNQRSSSAHAQDERETQRQQYRKQLDTALDEEDDPLSVYHQFVQWTIKSYGETDPKSGLIELLEEATRKFKNDPLYKADLRYLKLWTLYAKHSDRHHSLSIYKFLMTSGIGISYSLLYEEYANALELEGRKQDADTIYRRGIKKQVRPLERLKTKYKDFQARVGPISPAMSSSKATSRKSSSRNLTDEPTSTAVSGSSKSSTSSTAASFSTSSTAGSRYALMMAPPAPGKRPEKLNFNLSLLFSDGQEYSAQEARARSMGLLGKKWGPPPPSEMPRSAAEDDFDEDDDLKTVKYSSRKKSLMGGAEPTVTINTKEALADVFGMYNSPEKTRVFPGSKHAPVKKVDSVTSIMPPHVAFSREAENVNTKTPSTFRPFVDENAQPNRITPGAKFTPFVDPGAQKTAVITPRSALGAKDVATPVASNENASRPKSKASVANDKPVFSKVFAPTAKFAPQRNNSGETRKKEGSESRTFKPFVDESAKTPFKVFSRPGENDGGAPGAHTHNGLAPKTPNATFKPFVDKTPAFTPFRDSQEVVAVPLTDKAASGPKSTPVLPAAGIPKVKEGERPFQELVVGQEEEAEEYEDECEEQEQPEAQFEVAAYDGEYEEDEDQYYRDAPLGGRFGQFNVMTPITERTCEYTMGTTPKDHQYESPEEGSSGSPRSSSVFVPPQVGEREALKNAERLAAELREEPEVEGEEDEGDEVGDELEEEYVEVQNDRLVDTLEESAAALQLSEEPSHQLRFSNPCNPFEPSILSSLLSQLPSDEQFYDLPDQTSRQVEALEKSTRKSAPASPYTLTLDGHRFMVSEKLGEGGFGSVFKARDMGKRTTMEEEDDDYDDLDMDLDVDLDDDESSSCVAIKVVKPRNIWEYHVLRSLHASLPSSLRRSLVLPHALYAYADESFLVLDLCPQGMLLNIINNAVSAGVSQQGACLDELLVVFFSIELIRLVEGIHNAGFIHGDLKIDNCLLRLEDIPGGPSAWDAQYQPSGEDGWSFKGLKVIDFGRTIDTRMFPPGQTYLTDWATDERDCFEMREGGPWTFQTDYFGLAGIIYCMLFGKYIQESSITTVSSESSETRRYKIGTPLKRYWQGDIWNSLFDILLNPSLVRPDGALPICEELASVRKDMEAWLQTNCNRSSNTLKGLLKKVEKSCYTT